MVEKQLSLTWNHHGSTYRSMFNILRQKNLLTDITLACDGCQFSAHKLVLATCSQYFQTMLCAVPDGGHPIVYLRDVAASEMKAILEFMYTGEACLPQSQVGSLLKTAECLKIKGLGVQPTVDDDALIFNDDVPDALCDEISQSKINLDSDKKGSDLCSKPNDSSNKKRVFPSDDQDSSSNSVENLSYSSPPMDLSEPSPKKRKMLPNIADHPPTSCSSAGSLSLPINIGTSDPSMAKLGPKCTVDHNIKSEPSSLDLYTNTTADDLSESTLRANGPKSEKADEPLQSTENCSIYDSAAIAKSTNDALAAILDLEEKYVGSSTPLRDWDTRKPNYFPVHSSDKPKETHNSKPKSFPYLSDSTDSHQATYNPKHPPSQNNSSPSLKEDKKESSSAGEVAQEVACSNSPSFEEEAQLYLEAFTRSAGLSASSLRSMPEDGGMPVDCSIPVQDLDAGGTLAGGVSAQGAAVELEDLENRPFTCPICQKKFGKAAILKRHHLAHFRPYSCNVCQRSFTRREVLAEHLQEHNGADMRLPCPVCAMTIKRKRNLQAHIKVKHPEYYRHKLESKQTLF